VLGKKNIRPMQAVVPPLADSEFPPDWAEPAAPAAPTPRQVQPQWVVWAEFVLFCLGPALGFCLARWW
jgi:hypothetical protein